MEKGVYCLVLFHKACTIRVGALGDLTFPRGWHVYTGSAQGQGGLIRVQRHVRLAVSKNQTKHWHIDYLLGDPGFILLSVLCACTTLTCRMRVSQKPSVGSQLPVSGVVIVIASHIFPILMAIRSISSPVRWYRLVLNRSSQQSIPSRDSVD